MEEDDAADMEIESGSDAASRDAWGFGSSRRTLGSIPFWYPFCCGCWWWASRALGSAMARAKVAARAHGRSDPSLVNGQVVEEGGNDAYRNHEDSAVGGGGGRQSRC